MSSLTRIAFRLLGYLFLLGSASFLASPQEAPPNPPPDKTPLNVNLSVAVVDHQHHSVPDLKAENFTLFEDNQPQNIVSVRGGDVPACVGLLVDTSGSMRPKFNTVAKAVMDLVNSINPLDQVFLVNFNDNAYIDQDFTKDRRRIDVGLHRGLPKGGTALYDSLLASIDHFSSAVKCDKRVLVIVSDGEDNESRATLAQVLDELRNAVSPTIYAIGMPNDPQPTHRGKDKHALEQLTSATGGALYSTGNLNDLDKLALRVAQEIESLYQISYVPANQQLDGTYRNIKVELQPARKDVTVRSRSGYAMFAAPAPKVVNTAAPAKAPAPESDAGPQPDMHGPGCITGVVVDENKKPVAGIKIRILPLSAGRTGPHSFATSDENGEFRSQTLEDGTYQVETVNMREGYPPTSLPLYRPTGLPVVTVRPGGGCSNIIVSVGPKAGHLNLTVLDAATHEQLSRFRVTLQRTGDLTSTLSLNSNGQRGILVPPLTEVVVQVSALGYQKSESITVKSIPPDGVKELTVELKPEGNRQ